MFMKYNKHNKQNYVYHANCFIIEQPTYTYVFVYKLCNSLIIAMNDE